MKQKDRPQVPEKLAAYLTFEEVRSLLLYVEDKPYGLAIWLSIYLGLRVGEVQALRWTDIDLKNGLITIRRTFARREGIIREWPKGKKHHEHIIPPELLEKLRVARATSRSNFVVTSQEVKMLAYGGYYKALKRYCAEIGVRVISTHGLRHSTSGVYMKHGATRSDMVQLLAHASGERVTQRYIHTQDRNVDNVAKVLRLFPEKGAENSSVSPKFPQTENSQVDQHAPSC